ncbi:CmcJ/NvfI family oxidoreductase [Marinomonas colpomeniae]|uniref:Methyltransferase n=1 Tax=Marinomonas colpomeniae TaxID=2774408 RepID=A0ABR8P0E2_9GAMM|nr:CmcJ/NvfI family oxidoreductase [Marinomonas colpomeniae]MBD5771762.1 methyltransferase [Marinomonas colpomeniae]
MKYKAEKTKLHYIRNESTTTPVINYSGHDELQEYSDGYRFQETDIINARSATGTAFNLDKQGFELVSFTPNDVDFLDPKAVKSSYYTEVEALIKEQIGATHVFAFDHTVRRGLKDSNRHPAYHIHNDYTHETGSSRAVSVLGEEIINRFAGKRMVQINVWRSIAGVVNKDPLAFMDHQSLDEKDLVKAKIAFNDIKTGEKHHGEIFAVKQNPAQKWYFYPQMDSSEAVLIKGFDSDKSKAHFAMHTAFPLADQNENSVPRQSIETRTYAFFDV